MEDKEFLEKVHTRQIRTLYAGVKIPCMLRIEYDLDDKLNPVPSSDKYSVTQVVGDVIEPEEENFISLFNKDEKNNISLKQKKVKDIRANVQIEENLLIRFLTK